MPKKSTDVQQALPNMQRALQQRAPGTESVERETGFEPATSTLARSHSTTELLPLSSPIINEASERGKINAITTGKARGTRRPPPVRLLFGEPRRPGPPERVQKHFRSTQGATPSESPWHISVMARPLRVPFGGDDLAVAHVNDLVAILRRFRIVRDHQDGLAEFLV